MKLSRSLLIAISLLLTLGTGIIGFIHFKNQQLEKPANANESDLEFSKRIAAIRKSNLLKVNQQPLSIPPSVKPLDDIPHSSWKDAEKSLYQKLLLKKQFDVLIVPFQVQGFGLDRATRSLMTAEISNAMIREGRVSTPDPYIVSRALGDGSREFKQNEVYKLADKLGVKRIIWGYVGHNRKNQMSLSIHAETREPGSKSASISIELKKYTNITFSDENPPIEVYQSLLPEILSSIGVNKVGSTTASNNIVEVRDLPSSPIAIAAGDYPPETNTLYFQLLASITPENEARTRERFVEKSYLASLNISKSSPFYKALKARTLMMLGLRPAALAVLGEPKSLEEKELHAYLNGNLPTVEKYSVQLNNSVFKMIALLELNNLISAYNSADKIKSSKLASSLKLPSKEWNFLIARAFVEDDLWTQFENINVKLLLDKDFPIKDYSAENLLRGTAAAGGSDNLQIVADLSVRNHILKLIETDKVEWCCSPKLSQPSKFDYLNLIEAIGNSNLMRRADLLVSYQAAPESALKYLNTIESSYKDYPKFSFIKAKAQIGHATNLSAKEKVEVLREAQENIINVWLWEQGQTQLSANAWDLSGELNQKYSNFLNITRYDNTYASDYPFQAYYPEWESGGSAVLADANSEAALKNSVSNLKPFNYLAWSYSGFIKQDEKFAALLKSIEGRFEGSTTILNYKAEVSIKDGNYPQAEQYLKDSIKFQPKYWGSYATLANLLIQQGKLDEAKSLASEFYGFEDGAEINPVGLSNHAYDIGSKFYWLGEFSLATPFYKRASKIETGSAADINSQSRLNLLQGNYLEALKGLYRSATRYNSPFFYRDFLCLLHVSGDSTSAHDAFNVLSGQLDSLAIWQSAMVGQRMEGRTESEIEVWTKQNLNSNLGKNNNLAAKYFLQSTVTDRIPTQQSIDYLKEIAAPAWQISYHNKVVEKSNNQETRKILGPLIPNNASKGGFLPLGVFDSAEKTAIKSNLVYFSEAYRQIKLKNFAEANALLQEASKYYDFSNSELVYILPYYVFTAAQTSNISSVESYLSKIAPNKHGFEYLLAKATILGVSGKTDQSIRMLKRAHYKRPFSKNHSIQTEYEFADIANLLFETTNKPEFKELALDWAKKNQKFYPWFSWAYAMEATLTSNAHDRKKAIAIGFYLDPKSEMLAKIPQSEIAIAKKEFEGKIPFLIDSSKSAEKANI